MSGTLDVSEGVELIHNILDTSLCHYLLLL